MKKVELACECCGKKERFPASSPAALVLTASEASKKVGWSFKVGFYTMLTGDYHNRCPDCKEAKHD